MELKPGYKQTEVGVIPKDWDVIRIRDVASVRTGPFGSSLHESDYVHDGTPIITVEHLSEHGVIHSNLPMVSEMDRQRLKAYSLEQHDIVFSRVGSVDRNALISHSETGWLFSGRLLRIRPNNNKAFAPYLSYHFHYEKFKQRVKSVAVGQTMASLNTQIINDIIVVLPPLPEQRAIAAALSDMDALIASLDRLIAKKRDIKQAAMQQLLTGKRRLSGFGGEWEAKRLGDVCGKITTGKLDANAMKEDGEYPFFTCAREHYWINKYAFDAEALLISGNGANVGYIHYYKGKFNAYQRTYVITDFSEEIHFIKLFMDRNLQQRIGTEVNAGNTPYIKMDTLTDMSVAIPREKEEQIAIATILCDIDAEIAALEAHREKTKLLKQGMMQDLLTGRIRLV